MERNGSETKPHSVLEDDNNMRYEYHEILGDGVSLVVPCLQVMGSCMAFNGCNCYRARGQLLLLDDFWRKCGVKEEV